MTRLVLVPMDKAIGTSTSLVEIGKSFSVKLRAILAGTKE
jgi:hypothetical protein